MKTILIVPALNEAAVVGDLVRRVPRDVVDEVIVVDNASTDATAAVARGAGARVVSEPRRGYGAACFAGVMALPADAGIAVFIDADGSQRPEEIPHVVAPILAGRADLVLGARALDEHHPAHAAAGTRLVARFVAWRWRLTITDFGPLRAVRRDLLERLRMRDRASGWPVEMVIKAAVLGARIVEVPVSHASRIAGRSKVSGTFRGTVRAGYGFVSAVLRASRDVSREKREPMNDPETLITVPQVNELDLILAAFDAAGYRSRSSTVGRLECHRLDALALLFTVGGHGKTQHAVHTQHLIEQRPTIHAVICAGAAGSLSADLTPGDVVVGISTVEHDYKLRFVQRPLPRHDADMRLADEFRQVAGQIGSRFRVLFGEIASGDEDVVDRARAAELRKATGALCVAWEGAGAARAARFSRRPFLELRAITDSADHSAAGDFHTNLKHSMPNLAQVLLKWSLLRGSQRTSRS